MKITETEDKIGRKELVEKIASCAERLAEGQNVCIAIDGGWGSGKSFVMQMLYDRLNGNDGYLVVQYDAWECSYYEEPLIAIFSSILDSAGEKLLRLHDREAGAKAVVKEIGKDLLEALGGQKNMIGALATVLKQVGHYAAVCQNGISIDTKNRDAENFRSYQMYLREVKSCLNGFTESVAEQGQKNKLIVLVDELDRCLPDMQLKILERLHHLFDVKNCAVICAVNAERVAANMNASYGVDGYEYLRKFFDLTYKLEKSSELYLRRLLTDLVALTQKMNVYATDADDPADLAYFYLTDGGGAALQHLDNRELTRYYHAIVSACTDFGWERLSAQILFNIILGLFINRYCDSKFLSEDRILKENHVVPYYNGTVQYIFRDYLKDYFGIDAANISLEHRQPYSTLIQTFFQGFNEMPFYSLSNARNGLATEKGEACAKLRELILLYGGDKNEAGTAQR